MWRDNVQEVAESDWDRRTEDSIAVHWEGRLVVSCYKLNSKFHI